MRISAAMIVLAGLADPALAQCQVTEIERGLLAPLEGLQETTFDTTLETSRMGGEWKIYRDAGGKLHTIIRSDFDELGRMEYRLSIISPSLYGISVLDVEYLRNLHAQEEDGGEFGIAKESKTYFFFCDGQLHLPQREFGIREPAIYVEEGINSQKLMLLDKDVADLVKDLKR